MRTLPFVLFAALALSPACGKKSQSAPATAEDKAAAAIPTLTVDEVDQQLAAGKVTPVDCNGEPTRKKMGVVPGAVRVTSDDSYAASELPADKSKPLVFYCMNPG